MFFVDLPVGVENGIQLVILLGSFHLLNFAIARFPLLAFLEKYREEWALAGAYALINFLENRLPSDLAEVGILAVQLVVAVLLVALGKLGVAKFFQ